jgi:hypothetical protein
MRSSLACLTLLFFLSAPPAPAQNRTGDLAARLIERVVANEQQFVARLRQYHPLLETYLQELDESDPEAPPLSDHYLLGRLDLRQGVNQIELTSSAGFQPRSGWFARPNGIRFSPAGFAQMVMPDAGQFNRAAYHFEFVRREFLGELRCLAFDVEPKNKKAAGRFIGRIWVEDHSYQLVRFNGTYTQSKAAALFFHFDSWRVNVAPGLFLPAFVYVEEVAPARRRAPPRRIKGHTRLWGYHAVRPDKWQELTDLLIEAEDPVLDRAAAVDPSPLEAQRLWLRQAEENILQRMEKSGLLAPPGEVDQVLNTVVNNLLAASRADLDVKCRVLLTTPLESFAAGRTIVISRGLIDVLPDEASLAMVLASELAHIVLGHRTDSMFAFSDQTMFEEPEILRRLRFSRPPEDVERASKEAVRLLSSSPYKEKLSNAGLFLKALGSRAPRLPHLIQANLNHQMLAGNNLLHLSELVTAAPELEESKIEQIAALPLGSRVKLDPWTNRITLIQTRPVSLLSAREKMPFEITPLAPHLARAGSAAEPRKAGGSTAARSTPLPE